MICFAMKSSSEQGRIFRKFPTVLDGVPVDEEDETWHVPTYKKPMTANSNLKGSKQDFNYDSAVNR